MAVNRQEDFKGVWTAVATPFLNDGSIDFPAYEKLLQMQADAKVKGVVVCGTTGEAPTLERNEKLELIKVTRRVLPQTIRVMAGTGGNSTKDSVALSKDAAAAGADSLLVVTPPYNKPTLNGLVQHFTAIAQAAPGVPICLYHVPGRTAQLLNADAIVEITRVKGVSAVKEASGDMALFSRARQKSDAAFLSGDDITYLPSLSVGAEGCISVVSNIYPKALVALSDAFFSGESEKARTIHDALFSIFETIHCETNPCPLKAALSIKKLAKNNLRLPLAPVTSKSFSAIEECLTKTDTRLREMHIL